MFFDDVASAPTLRRARDAGRIRRLATGLWSADMDSPPGQLVAANIWEIVGRVMPEAVIVDRTAATDGRVDAEIVTIATDERSTPLELPGVVILPRPLERAEDDLPWIHGLAMSSPVRTLVDNLAVSRGRGRAARTLSIAEVQDWLARKSIAWGAERMARLHQDAVALAAARGHADRGEQLDELFAELEGRQPPRAGSGAFLTATLAGQAWDADRLVTFDAIAGALATPRPDDPTYLAAHDPDGELPFYEAYFSNFIEGTEFTIEAAREIVETQTPPAMRSADGHDILGTHRCVVDPVGRARTSTDVDVLVRLLRQRHATLLGGRPDMGPGEWKSENNQVGSYAFVDHSLVEGTLRRGLARLEDLPLGLPRALYVMFVIAEVHPFLDGNGRAARLMMNAELSSVGECRIVVPTVLRNEYVAALRRASLERDVDAVRSVLGFARRWTAAMPWTDAAATAGMLLATNATMDSTEAAASGRRLELP